MTPDEIKPRMVVVWFAQEMEKALRAHDKTRGFAGWTNDHPVDLLNHLLEEVKELKETISPSEDFKEAVPDPVQTIDEAVDVANMAMMIADIARRLI